MSNSLDLNILPMVRQSGQDKAEMPGLFAVTPPRRAARGRASDSLVLYLEMAGNAPLIPEQINQLLARLTQTYYKTPGSVTAAMRTVAETLNQYLLDRNLRISSSGRQGIGLLIQVVLRNDVIYMAQSGPVHAYVIAAQETQHMHNAQGAGRGLGLSRTTPIRYFQAKMAPSDFLLITVEPPPGWTENTLRPPSRVGLEGMRRKLLDHAARELKAVLIQAQSGSGKLRLLRRKAGLPDMAQPTAAQPIAAQPEAEPRVEREVVEEIPTGEVSVAALEEAAAQAQVEALPSEEAPQAPDVSEERQAAQPEKVEIVASTGLRRAGWGRPARTSTPAASPPVTGQGAASPRKASPPRQPRPELSAAPLKAVLSTFGRALSSVFGPVGRGLGSILKNVLPDESLLNLSPSAMIFFAVAVPVVMGVIGARVYVQRGRAAQHQVYYEQALQAAEQAVFLSDPAELRSAWEVVVNNLDQAEAYAVTEESQALRAEARTTLDELDFVERLDYQPAIIGLSAGLGESVMVTRMVATDGDLYMLDSSQGVVKRAILTGSGYQIDPTFNCGPSYGTTIVGPLIDIVALPRGSTMNATILGMDANGVLLYCVPGGGAPLSAQMAPPNINFGSPKALTLDTGDLYVLDPQTNAVWIYRRMEFAQQPRLFFGDQIPPMQDVIDLAVNLDDLYLLHADGHMTMCTYSVFVEAPTRCEDPILFTDPRPGRMDGPVLPDSLFSQMYFSPPPDPSIYMLDPGNQAIFHFSLRMAFQRQLRALEDLPEGPATAFAVSPNRTVFIAVGNEVFYAALP